VGYLYSVSTDECNVLLENKYKSVVKVTHRRGHVTTVGAEIKNPKGLGSVPNKHKNFSLVENMIIV
jgi:hypothetical protein